MKLDQFIRETLLEILNGVLEAKEEAGRASVHELSTEHSESTVNRIAPQPISPQPVEFDVAVIVTETTESKVEGGASISVLKVAGNVNDSATETSTHRIRFSVPVVLAERAQVTTTKLTAIIPKKGTSTQG